MAVENRVQIRERRSEHRMTVTMTTLIEDVSNRSQSSDLRAWVTGHDPRKKKYLSRLGGYALLAWNSPLTHC